ncbi:unnamed protein product [Ectocarpus fasciculatus]
MAGTLFPSPEPETPPIDRWARGWVASRSTTARDWDRFPRGSTSDEGSEGGRSLRSVRSTATGMTSAHRHGGGGGGGHARHRPHSSSCKDDSSGVPFPLAPEVREDQSLPPTIPGHNGRKSRKGGDSGGKRGRGGRPGKRAGGNGGEGVRHQGIGGESESGCLWDGGTDGSDRQADDLDSRLKDLGGREWTIDGCGELLIVDKLQGDAMPKTVVSALYNFRDVQDKLAGGENGGGGGGGDGDGDGGLGGGKRHRGGSIGGKTGGGIGGIGGSSSFSKERKQSSSSLRRASRRRSSRRLTGSRRRGSGAFFELEPTLQPNLTNSLDRPGPGVSVSDGGSLKEGPSWPQDPDHMSRSEYRERQRRQDLSGTSMLDGGEDASSLGFSLGSVKSAPALRGLGLGLNGNGGGGDGTAGGGRRAVSGGRGSGGVGGRGTSITAFEDVNPFAGGIRVDISPPAAGDGRAVAAATGGDLSPLTASVGGQSGRFFPGAGPESSSVGETPDDPHLALVKDPDWGRNVRGSIKEAGYLPKVKLVSRERPLTHERPHTRNPRDPRNVPARPNAHVSPKNSTSSRADRNTDPQCTDDDGGSTKSSFPALPMSLTGWGEGGGGGSLGMEGGDPGRPARGKKGRGMITMTKPKEIIVQGLLR